jgi:hypothetical protein
MKVLKFKKLETPQYKVNLRQKHPRKLDSDKGGKGGESFCVSFIWSRTRLASIQKSLIYTVLMTKTVISMAKYN